jgi:hypothetical protein
MERHLSTGVSTIIALMAAHRAASRGSASARFSHEEVARIEALLRGWSPLAAHIAEGSIAINSHLQASGGSI